MICPEINFGTGEGVSIVCGKIDYPLGINGIISCKLTCQGEVIAGYLKSAIDLTNSKVLYCDTSDGEWKTNFKLDEKCPLKNMPMEVEPMKLDFFTNEIIHVSEQSSYFLNIYGNIFTQFLK